MKFKFLILGIIGALILWLGIIIVIDASKLSGLMLVKQNETDYLVVLNDESYTLRYVPKKNIEPSFGRALNEFGTDYALVRNDLPVKAQRFVALHEIYHLYDFKKNIHNSVISQEIHANLAALPYEPIGFLQTIFLTLTNPERMARYFQLFF